MAKEDLTGQKFDMLTVLGEVPKEKRHGKDGHREWYCQCDCGKTIQVASNSLKRKRDYIKSCGCLHSSNLVGKKFGMLTVIEKTDKRTKDKYIIWKCQCDCGNITYVATSNLKLGRTQSCGCIRSKGEQKVNQLLFDNNIDFATEFWFDDLKDKQPLRFDFAIINEDKSIKCLIEYQGEQHYQDVFHLNSNITQIHDQMKRDYCVKNNIPLIEIPYTDYDELNWEYLKEKIDALA